MIHKRSTALERSVKSLLESLNMLNGTKLTHCSDVDQSKFICISAKFNDFGYIRYKAICDTSIRPLFKTACTVGCRNKRHHSIRYQCTYACSGAYVLGTRMFLPLVCRGSVFGPCFVLHHLVSFLILQSFL